MDKLARFLDSLTGALYHEPNTTEIRRGVQNENVCVGSLRNGFALRRAVTAVSDGTVTDPDGAAYQRPKSR